MVAGLERFAEHSGRFADSFVLIGGAACDLWMGEQELRFRATEDLYIVVIVEAVDDEFIRAFWDFIREGEYATHQQGEGRPDFYRFAGPKHAAHPAQIELLTRNGLGLSDDARFTPIPAGDDLASLSAILMDGGYYDYVLTNGGWTFDQAETNNPDTDPFTSGDEWIADTDPTDSNDYFRITGITVASPPVISFESSSNRWYTMLGCSNLVDGIWTNVPGAGPREGTGGADPMTDTNETLRNS